MLLTCKVHRRRNNNVIPITMTRALPHVATQKTRQMNNMSPLKNQLDNHEGSHITTNEKSYVYSDPRMENFREQIRGMNRHANASKTAAMSSRPIFEGSPRLGTTITQGTRQDLPKKQLLKERVIPSPRVVEQTWRPAVITQPPAFYGPNAARFEHLTTEPSVNMPTPSLI